MQLILSNNRVVAYGEKVVVSGTDAINTVSGVTYKNATVVECDNLPNDINEVGYEYHAGIFVPCAPYGKGDGTGNFMEVCNECKTPRDSGLSIKKYKDLILWESLSTVAFNKQFGSANSSTIEVEFGVDTETLSDYTEAAIVLKSGATFVSANDGKSGSVSLSIGTTPIVSAYSYREPTGTYIPTTITIDTDTVLCADYFYRTFNVTSSSGETRGIFFCGLETSPLKINFSGINGGTATGTIELKARGKYESIIA